MSKNSQIQIRIPEQEKEAARELFARYGLSLSSAVRMFLFRSLQENRLPFSFDAPETEEDNLDAEEDMDPNSRNQQ